MSERPSLVEMLMEAAAAVVKTRSRIPLVLWRAGTQVSGPGAWIVDPPPATLSIARPPVFRSLDEVVQHLTQAKPATEEYVLQYIATEPRTAVYLYAPEALAQMESA